MIYYIKVVYSEFTRKNIDGIEEHVLKCEGLIYGPWSETIHLRCSLKYWLVCTKCGIIDLFSTEARKILPSAQRKCDFNCGQDWVPMTGSPSSCLGQNSVRGP